MVKHCQTDSAIFELRNRIVMICFAFLFTVFASCHAFAAAIENVIALQRPGTGVVDIYYDLVINEGGTTTVSASVEGGGDSVVMRTLSGDIGHVVPGPARHIVWDAQADNPECVLSDLRLRVEASRMDAVVNAGMDYLPVGDYLYYILGGGYYSGVQGYGAGGIYIDRQPVSIGLWNRVYNWAVQHGYTFTKSYGTSTTSGAAVSVEPSDAWVWCNARSQMENLPQCHKEGTYGWSGFAHNAKDHPFGAPERNGGYRLPYYYELVPALIANKQNVQQGRITEWSLHAYDTYVKLTREATDNQVASYTIYNYYTAAPLYCVRDSNDRYPVVETFPSNYSSSFTIDTRVNSPTFPKDFKIVGIKSKYCDGEYGKGHRALFLSGVSCNVEFEAEVYGGDLACLERVDNEIAPAVGEQISGEDGKFSLDVGAFSPGNSFAVRARSADGRYSQPFRLNFDIASQNGDRFGIAETQPADRNGLSSLIYRTVDVSTENLFDDLSEDAMQQVGDNVAQGKAAFADRLKSISFSPSFDLYRRMDSSEGIIRDVILIGGDYAKLTRAELNKVEGEKFKDVSFMKLGAWGFGGRLGYEYEYHWDNNSLQWIDKPGSAMLSLSARIKLFRAWYGAASVGLDAGANGTFRFCRVDGRFEGGLETDELIYLTGTLGVGVPVVGAVEGSLTGGVFAKAGPMYDPYWNELGLQISWNAQWRLLVWSGDILPRHMPHTLVKWWWVGGDGEVILNAPEVMVDAAVTEAIKDVSATNTVTRDYLDSYAGGGTGNGHGWPGIPSVTTNLYPTSYSPVKLGDNGMPGPNPQAPGDTPTCTSTSDGGTGGTGSKHTPKIVMVADNPGRSSRTRATIVTISDQTNTTFTAEDAVWDDGTPDYNPVTARMTNGCSVVAWMNGKAGAAENASLGETMSGMEIATAVWNDEVCEWMHMNITDNGAYDRSPVLKTATNGTAAVAWIRNAYTNYVGSATEPNQVCFARYMDGIWTAERIVVPSVGRVRKLDMAYDGVRAAIVFNEEDDPRSGATQRLSVVTSDCTTWEPCRVVAESPVNNSAVYAYYDGEGDLQLVWNEDGTIKIGLYTGGALDAETIDTDGHLVPGDYVFTLANSGRMALVWMEQMNDGNPAMGPVSMTFNPAYGTWSLPCALTYDGKNKTEVSSAFNDAGDLEVFYATPNVATNEQGVAGTVSSGFAKVTRRHGGDIAILMEDISFSTNIFTSGETVDVYYKIKNLGDEPVSNVMMRVYDRSNGMQYLTNRVCISGLQDGQSFVSSISYDKITELRNGQSLEIKVEWTVPESVTSQTGLNLEFRCSCSGDVMSSNNYVVWRYGSAAVSLVSPHSKMDANSQSVRHVSISLENAGLASIPAGTTVAFRRGDREGAMLAAKTVGSILTGAEGIQEVGFAWDISSITPTSNVEKVHVTVELPESANAVQHTLEAEVQVDVTPVAKTPLTAYTLIYDANGGVGAMPVGQPFYNEWAALASNVFTRTGYSFAGWSLSPTGDVVYADGAFHWNVPMFARGTATLFAVWERNAEETSTTEVPVPFAWLKAYYPEVTNATDNLAEQIANFEEIAKRPTGKYDGTGRSLSVWQEYVAGTDPTNAESRLETKIEMKNGAPRITWKPNLNEGGVNARTYTIFGKTNLTDKAWYSPTNDASHFFKVTVEMP